MKCDREDCTGVHDKSKPRRTWCPGTKLGAKYTLNRKCDRADCNGIHSRRGDLPIDQRYPRNAWCEGAKEKNKQDKKRRQQTIGTYEYNEIHGIGKAGIQKHKREKLERQTPGTYKYNANHGIGKPGLNAYIAGRKLRLRKQKQNNIKKLQELEKEIENGR